jgi:hypothetical protein
MGTKTKRGRGNEAGTDNLASSPFLYLSSLPPRMKLCVHGFEPLLVHVRVDLRGGDVAVAQQFLDDAQVGSAADQVGGETVGGNETGTGERNGDGAS